MMIIGFNSQKSLQKQKILEFKNKILKMNLSCCEQDEED